METVELKASQRARDAKVVSFQRTLWSAVWESFVEGRFEIEVNDLVTDDAVHAGLVEMVEFDPDEHIDNSGACEAGDPYYRITPLGSSLLVGASLPPSAPDREGLEGDIRIAIWNAGMKGGMGQDLTQAFIQRAMAEPTMVRALALPPSGIAEAVRERCAKAVLEVLYPKNEESDWTEFASIRAGCAISAVNEIRALDLSNMGDGE